MNIQTRRKKRIRAKLFGTAERPRLSVFRSLNQIYGQIINDEIGKTLISANSRGIKKEKGKIGIAHKVGMIIANQAQNKGITQVVFDRGSYLYHGRVKALAEGAKKGGLKF